MKRSTLEVAQCQQSVLHRGSLLMRPVVAGDWSRGRNVLEDDEQQLRRQHEPRAALEHCLSVLVQERQLEHGLDLSFHSERERVMRVGRPQRLLERYEFDGIHLAVWLDEGECLRDGLRAVLDPSYPDDAAVEGHEHFVVFGRDDEHADLVAECQLGSSAEVVNVLGDAVGHSEYVPLAQVDRDGRKRETELECASVAGRDATHGHRETDGREFSIVDQEHARNEWLRTPS